MFLIYLTEEYGPNLFFPLILLETVGVDMQFGWKWSQVYFWDHLLFNRGESFKSRCCLICGQLPGVGACVRRRAVWLPGEEGPANSKRGQEVLQTDHLCFGFLPQSFHLVGVWGEQWFLDRCLGLLQADGSPLFKSLTLCQFLTS